jgi:hypothetical protein
VTVFGYVDLREISVEMKAMLGMHIQELAFVGRDATT